VDSCNVVNWIQNILLHCVVLFTAIAVEQRVEVFKSGELDTEICIAFCFDVNSDSGKTCCIIVML